jgi:hypothetical protein
VIGPTLAMDRMAPFAPTDKDCEKGAIIEAEYTHVSPTLHFDT